MIIYINRSRLHSSTTSPMRCFCSVSSKGPRSNAPRGQDAANGKLMKFWNCFRRHHGGGLLHFQHLAFQVRAQEIPQFEILAPRISVGGTFGTLVFLHMQQILVPCQRL